MNRLAILGLAWFGTACGGPGTGPVPRSVAQEHCGEICERDLMCDPNTTETLQECTDDCVGDVTRVIREDAFIDVADCISALSCTADEDVCLRECSPTKTHNDYETACRAKVAECGGAGSAADSLCEVSPSGSDDDGFLCLLIPTAISELTDCFSMSCTAVEACLSGVFERYGL
jgi:hypothetical protein